MRNAQSPLRMLPLIDKAPTANEETVTWYVRGSSQQV